MNERVQIDRAKFAPARFAMPFPALNSARTFVI